jgi:uncharacterized protein (DUF58 family)
MGTKPGSLSLDFIAQLERLSLRARRPVKGWGAGQRRSRRTGHSVEFADFRAYGSGDDMRYVDWSIYSRTGRMHVKLFVDDEDLCLHMLVDGSASMASGTPSKLQWASQLASSLSFIGLSGQERVGAGIVRNQVVDGIPPTRGRGRINAFFDFFQGVRGEGETDLNHSMRSYSQTAKGAGLAVVISDLLDSGGYADGLKALQERGFEVHVIHILSPEDLKPDAAGDVRLVDQENGESLLLRLDDRSLAIYQARLNDFTSRAETFCLEHGIGYARFSSDIPVEDVVLGPLRGRLLD